MKIVVSIKLRSESSDEEGESWFKSLSDKQKKAYLRLHPNSKLGKPGFLKKAADWLFKKAPEEKDAWGRQAYMDAERVKSMLT